MDTDVAHISEWIGSASLFVLAILIIFVFGFL
jgi:hypothetical protein